MTSVRQDPTRRLDLVVLTNFLALGMIIAAVPRYLHGPLHASRFETGLATTIYFGAALMVRPFIGAAADRIGRRPFLVLPALGLATLSVCFTQAHSVLAIGIIRFLGGAMAALFFTAIALAVTDIVTPERRTGALSRQSVMTYTGFTLGPLAADRLIHLGWTWVWLVAAGLQVLTALLALPIPETRRADAPPAARGIGLDRRAARPAVGVMVANFSFSSVVAFLPEYAERHGIAGPGGLFAAYAISVVVVRGLTGRVADRVGPLRFTVPLLTIGSAGLAGLALAGATWQSFVAISVVGGSLGATFPAATAAALQRVGPDERGRAMGTALALGDIGQGSAGPLVGALSTSLGFRWVYGIPAILALLGALNVLTMPELRRAR